MWNLIHLLVVPLLLQITERFQVKENSIILMMTMMNLMLGISMILKALCLLSIIQTLELTLNAQYTHHLIVFILLMKKQILLRVMLVLQINFLHHLWIVVIVSQLAEVLKSNSKRLLLSGYQEKNKDKWKNFKRGQIAG